YHSVLISAYWCVTTVTTTGYGDYTPLTVGGKFIASATMVLGLVALNLPITIPSENFAHVLGLVALALPITILSENFAHVYQRQELAKLEELVR
ncbi:hypothetical protein T484DRAFT_1847914, partial [Baffinella frigidus]